MDKIKEKIEYFTKLQAEIIDLSKVADIGREKLIKEFNDKQAVLKSEYESKIEENDRTMKNKLEVYKAELKAWCGMTDGEKSSVIDLFKALVKVLET